MRLLLALVSLSACAPELSETDEQPLQWSLERRDEQLEALRHLDVLLDGSKPLTIGESCGFGSTLPRGRREVDELVRMRREELLRRALDAPTPEGRLYAAIGLARLGATTWADVRARAEREPKVEVCWGCVHSSVAGKEALSAYQGCADRLE